MTQDELKQILDRHCAWFRGEAGGERANLTGADLSNADLDGAYLTGADLRGANLTGANLSYANLRNANLTGANLHNANLTGADLRNAGLTGAGLTGADLTDADLTDANLTGADLRNADLTNANLLTVRGFIGFSFSAGRALGVATADYLQIGCKKLPWETWLADYKTIGTAEGYTPLEIRNYGTMIKAYYRVIQRLIKHSKGG